MNRRKILCFFVILSLFAASEGLYGYVRWHEKDPEVILTENEEDIHAFHVAKATYDNRINYTGWAFLELHTSKNSSDERQAFAAGYLEGFLTRDLIWLHWQNVMQGYCVNKTEYCKSLHQFIDDNEKFLYDEMAMNAEDKYWYQLKLYYMQLDGLAAGYEAITKDPNEKLTRRDFLLLNMLGDLEDLEPALSPSSVDQERLLVPEHCTGLVKLLPDLSNLYTAQVTWNSYQSMLRFQKKYVLHYKESPRTDDVIPGYSMAFSSYPGNLQSADDFYVISSGLVVAETTIGNNNMELYRQVKPNTMLARIEVNVYAHAIPTQVLEFARAMVANRLARSGHDWVSIFRDHNSGTYNNQWYIVDYKQFKASSKSRRGRARPGLLWLIEQIPAYTEAKDLTNLLLNQTYFPSYNIPYFSKIYKLSGWREKVAEYGDWFGYYTTPRAKILKRLQANVNNIHDMFLTMRYNDYTHDPDSACACVPPYSAENAVAARNDLNPPNGTYPFGALGHRSHGATDAKVTSATLFDKLQFMAVSSPTHNESRGIPPFRWSTFDLGAKISHVGHPDEWKFSPLVHEWKWG